MLELLAWLSVDEEKQTVDTCDCMECMESSLAGESLESEWPEDHASAHRRRSLGRPALPLPPGKCCIKPRRAGPRVTLHTTRVIGVLMMIGLVFV